MAGSLTYVKGDATRPAGTGLRIVPHIVNDARGWGAGFVVALSRRWRGPESSYRLWTANPRDFVLGNIQTVRVEQDIWIVNMLAQHGYWNGDPATPAVDYSALAKCLAQVAAVAVVHGATVHCPKFGAGLAGGDWRKIEQIIQDTLVAAGLNVTVYEYGG